VRASYKVKILGADMKFPKELEAKRTKCIVYTRVMGYLRPVESFNIGKVGEHKQRVLFEEKKDVASTKQA
jgi:hypothetical protein